MTTTMPDLISWSEIDHDTVTVNDYLLNRVRRGVFAYDHIDPDWRTYVDVRTLDMESTCQCIVGQTRRIIGTDNLAEQIHRWSDDGYLDFPEDLGLDFDSTLSHDGNGPTDNEQYRILAGYWTDAINRTGAFA